MTIKILSITPVGESKKMTNKLNTLINTLFVLAIILSLLSIALAYYAHTLPDCQQGTHTSLRHQTHQTLQYASIWQNVAMQRTTTEYLTLDVKVTHELCIVR